MRDAGKCSESSAFVVVDNFQFCAAARYITEALANFGEFQDNFAEFFRETNSGIFKKHLNCGKTDLCLLFHRQKRDILGAKRHRQILKIRKKTLNKGRG